MAIGKFGIKEVADVKFYNVGDVKFNSSTGALTLKATGTKPVLEFDTLKISNLEFTGETAEARGGKGNSVLISWDHSREATLTLEDALLSVESLNTMLSSKATTTTEDGTCIISVDANGFPGTYTVVGKTYARGTDGTDHVLTFVVFKAKVQAEASFEMTADGDPSTLNMTLKVLRCSDNEQSMGCAQGDLIKLIVDENDNNTKNPTITWPAFTT
jgi:hypothetical protein